MIQTKNILLKRGVFCLENTECGIYSIKRIFDEIIISLVSANFLSIYAKSIYTRGTRRK